MSTLYEIIELSNGDIALQRVDEKGEPLVSIHFSQESLYFLSETKFVVAKAMIEAGLQIASDIDKVSEPEIEAAGLQEDYPLVEEFQESEEFQDFEDIEDYHNDAIVH